jgi:hypothetical protein
VVASIVTGTQFTVTFSASTGSVNATQGYWNIADIEAATLKLYTGARAPTESDSASSFSETTYTGYSAKTLNARLSSTAGWSLPGNVGGGGTGTWMNPGGTFTPGATYNVAESTYPLQSFTTGSVIVINGYFVIGTITGLLWWSEQFAQAKSMGIGDVLQLTPRLGLSHMGAG